jgi:sec-independent protein translocase protein TatB
MFDVGFAEILLLSLVGLLVLGPERLPRVARTLGGMARKARGSWLSLKRSIEAEMRAEELKKPLENFKREFNSTVDDVKSGFKSHPVPPPVPPAAGDHAGEPAPDPNAGPAADPVTGSTTEAARPEPSDKTAEEDAGSRQA